MVVVQLLSRVRLVRPHGLQPARLLCPWDSPGKNTGVVCRFFLQGIFLTQESNPGLPHFRQILYCLSYQPLSYLPNNSPLDLHSYLCQSFHLPSQVPQIGARTTAISAFTMFQRVSLRKEHTEQKAQQLLVPTLFIQLRSKAQILAISQVCSFQIRSISIPEVIVVVVVGFFGLCCCCL